MTQVGLGKSLQGASGYFAVGVYHPKTGVNVGTLWRSASIYGASLLCTVGSRYRRQSADTMKSPWRTPLLHFANIDDLHTHLPWSCPLVGVELATDAKPLSGYNHPQRALYLLGAEDHGLPMSVLARCHSIVQIEAPGSESMNVAVAGSIVLHDRHVKANARRDAA